MNPLSMLLSFVTFVARTAPDLAPQIRDLLKSFGDVKGIPKKELLPALEDDLPDKVAEADKEVDDLISDLYPK